MVIKIAYDTVPHIRKIRKRHPYKIPITQPGRGQQKKVLNKWTDLKRVFNRETYTNWFGNSRFILLVNIEKINKWKHAWRENRIRPWGFRMVRTKQHDVAPVFKSMGMPELTNALRSSHSIPTMIVYAYGNEYSPIGNIESYPFIRKIINEFHNNKKKPNDYIIAGALDGRVLTQREIIAMLDYGDPMKQWQQLGGTLNATHQLPSIMQIYQTQLVRSLDHYIKENTKGNDNDDSVNESNDGQETIVTEKSENSSSDNTETLAKATSETKDS